MTESRTISEQQYREVVEALIWAAGQFELMSMDTDRLESVARKLAAAPQAAQAQGGQQAVGYVDRIALSYLAEPGGWARIEGQQAGLFRVPLYASPLPAAQAGGHLDHSVARSGNIGDPDGGGR